MCVCEQGRDREREGTRESQAGSVVLVQSPVQGCIPQPAPRVHDLSQIREADASEPTEPLKYSISFFNERDDEGKYCIFILFFKFFFNVS